MPVSKQEKKELQMKLIEVDRCYLFSKYLNELILNSELTHEDLIKMAMEEPPIPLQKGIDPNNPPRNMDGTLKPKKKSLD